VAQRIQHLEPRPVAGDREAQERALPGMLHRAFSRMHGESPSLPEFRGDADQALHVSRIACGGGRVTATRMQPCMRRSIHVGSRPPASYRSNDRGVPISGVFSGAAAPMRTAIELPPGLLSSGVGFQLLASHTLPDGSMAIPVFRYRASLV
jgi:hypothetical protein